MNIFTLRVLGIPLVTVERDDVENPKADDDDEPKGIKGGSGGIQSREGSVDWRGDNEFGFGTLKGDNA